MAFLRKQRLSSYLPWLTREPFPLHWVFNPCDFLRPLRIVDRHIRHLSRIYGCLFCTPFALILLCPSITRRQVRHLRRLVPLCSLMAFPMCLILELALPPCQK